MASDSAKIRPGRNAERNVARKRKLENRQENLPISKEDRGSLQHFRAAAARFPGCALVIAQSICYRLPAGASQLCGERPLRSWRNW